MIFIVLAVIAVCLLPLWLPLLIIECIWRRWGKRCTR